jgi:DNA-directed RNA polymerase specialized sigma24 family protein
MNAVLVQRESLKKALTDRARTGDRQAYEELLTVCLDNLKHLVVSTYHRYSWLREAVECEDLLQEVALAAWEELSEALLRDNPCEWLSRVALRPLYRQVVALYKQPCVESLDSWNSCSHTIIHRGLSIWPEHREDEVLRSQLDAVLCLLPAFDASVVRLRYGLSNDHDEMLSYREVTRLLGCPEYQVRYAESRALVTLQRGDRLMIGGAA